MAEKTEAPPAVVQVASTIVESMKQQPMMLALVVMQVVVVALIYFGVGERRKYDHMMTRFILERCLPAEKIPS